VIASRSEHCPSAATASAVVSTLIVEARAGIATSNVASVATTARRLTNPTSRRYPRGTARASPSHCAGGRSFGAHACPCARIGVPSQRVGWRRRKPSSDLVLIYAICRCVNSFSTTA
jgi:hypothetical protein